jgi:hypothetical protein
LAAVNVHRNSLLVKTADDAGVGQGENSLSRIIEIRSAAHETAKCATHQRSDVGRLAFQSQPSQMDEICVYIGHIVHEEP